MTADRAPPDGRPPDRESAKDPRLMENVLLIVHLVLAVFLIAVVLLQRSEGGALGIGGGGGGAISSRGATTALAKATWALAGAFIATSLALTIIAAKDSGSRSVIDRLGAEPLPGAAAPQDDGSTPLGGELNQLLVPPPAADDAPAASGGAAPSPAPSAPAPTTPPAAD